MGVHTVAVFSDGDAGAPFVVEADLAVSLGGRTAADTYLDVDKLIAAARRSGADCVHPGYGFLSENAAFASAVIAAGLTWIGPAPDAIAAMGDKLAAKATVAAVGVPVLTLQSADTDVAAAATEIGYPVLVKAAAGGGGKGMRVVGSASDLMDAVAGAEREAVAAFGDGTVFLERYLSTVRHVEVQVLGDTAGNLVHLFERECSIQRRHQKVVEESPSPAVTPDLRGRMGAAAARRGEGGGLPLGGHRRVPPRRRRRPRRVLVPRDEHEAPGRAPRHGGDHGARPRPRADPGRQGRGARLRPGRPAHRAATPSRSASTPRTPPSTSCPPRGRCTPGSRPPRRRSGSTAASRRDRSSASSSTRCWPR